MFLNSACSGQKVDAGDKVISLGLMETNYVRWTYDRL